MWHLTWQDPIALALAATGIGLAWWLHRRLTRTTGCASCHANEQPVAEATSERVGLDQTRLGRRLKERRS